MASNGENTPLLGSNENQNYYFLSASGRLNSDAGEFVEDIPPGATAEEFAPRVLPTTIPVSFVAAAAAAATLYSSTCGTSILIVLFSRKLLARVWRICHQNRKSKVSFQSCLGRSAIRSQM